MQQIILRYCHPGFQIGLNNWNDAWLLAGRPVKAWVLQGQPGVPHARHQQKAFVQKNKAGAMP